MLFLSFISGLHEVPARQVRFSNPQDIDQALKIALTVQEAERQEQIMKVFVHDFISRYTCARAQKTTVIGSQLTREKKVTRAQRYSKPCSAGKSESSRSRNTQTQEALSYKCHSFGHFARECSSRLKGEPDHLIRQVEKNRPSVRSTRVHPEASPTGKYQMGS
jgi:hypothetical protein